MKPFKVAIVVSENTTDYESVAMALAAAVKDAAEVVSVTVVKTPVKFDRRLIVSALNNGYDMVIVSCGTGGGKIVKSLLRAMNTAEIAAPAPIVWLRGGRASTHAPARRPPATAAFLSMSFADYYKRVCSLNRKGI